MCVFLVISAALLRGKLSLIRFSLLGTDFRTKFHAIHREYSPKPRKFYAFTTSVTVSLSARVRCPAYVVCPSGRVAWLPRPISFYGASPGQSLRTAWDNHCNLWA